MFHVNHEGLGVAIPFPAPGGVWVSMAGSTPASPHRIMFHVNQVEENWGSRSPDSANQFTQLFRMATRLAQVSRESSPKFRGNVGTCGGRQLFSNAESAEDLVEDVLNVDPAGEAAERMGRATQILSA